MFRMWMKLGIQNYSTFEFTDSGGGGDVLTAEI